AAADVLVVLEQAHFQSEFKVSSQGATQMKHILNFVLASILLIASPMAISQMVDTPASHSDAKTDAHHGCGMMAVEHSADEGMGFSQAKTTHHFRLTADGGVISVEAND